MIPTAISAVVGLAAVLGLVFYLVRWTRSVTERADDRVSELRTQDSRIRGLETAVAERNETIDTLKRDVARAERGVKVAKDDFDEILQTLASGGDAAGITSRINSALDRLSKLSEAGAPASGEDPQSP